MFQRLKTKFSQRNRESGDRQIVISLVIITLIGFGGGKLLEAMHGIPLQDTKNLSQAAAITATNNLLPLKTAPAPITLGFVGDIMLDRGVRASVDKNLDSDYAKLFANAGFLKEPDIMFANLEGPVSDTGTDKHNLYSFRMDPAVMGVIKNAGIDIVSFANNHVGDWGRPAFEDTITRLNAAGILVCGAGMNKTEASAPTIIEQGGEKIGYICFSDVGPDDMAATNTQSGILLASDPDFDSIIKTAAKNVDALVVSFHWGVEYQAKHTARQEALAKRAVDDGAAFVEGEHPHVVEDSDAYKGTSIFYSLGNFIFDQKFSDATLHGMYLTATAYGKNIYNNESHATVQDKKTYVVSLEK